MGRLGGNLANPEPLGYRRPVGRPKPKPGEFLGVSDEILEATSLSQSGNSTAPGGSLRGSVASTATAAGPPT
jgi:hypothetical protein